MNLTADILMKDFLYDLPGERIAQYPADKRDGARLLIRKGDGSVSCDLFSNLPSYVEEGSCMVFNDSRVIPARLFFKGATGKKIELFCLKPVEPDGFDLALHSREGCIWECLAGNLKAFKYDTISHAFQSGSLILSLRAEKLSRKGNTLVIRFSWDNPSLTFGQVLSLTGRTPLPPYIRREAEEEDTQRYQTVFARYDGSVAAPTAGLHFTPELLLRLDEKNVTRLPVTLHVGAGTFLPVKTASAAGHVMHPEIFSVARRTVESLLAHSKPVLAVGTTSVRALESLYWLGVKLQPRNRRVSPPLELDQWEAWQLPQDISFEQSMLAVLDWFGRKDVCELQAETRMMIVPGYRFRMVDRLITNFHQPQSSLLLLVAAFLGSSWKEVYRHALDNDFRFLSYGDSSLLIKDTCP